MLAIHISQGAQVDDLEELPFRASPAIALRSRTMDYVGNKCVFLSQSILPTHPNFE